jgi:uncharacterized protein
MISEACATAVPVFVAEPKRSVGRVGEFVQSMIDRERARAQDLSLAPYAITPLNESARAAQWLKEKLGF